MCHLSGITVQATEEENKMEPRMDWIERGNRWAMTGPKKKNCPITGPIHLAHSSVPEYQTAQ